MTDNLSKRYEDLISKAHDAIYRGDRNRARILASQAAKLSPNKEEAWLLLASIASPKAAIDYSKKALNLFEDLRRAGFSVSENMSKKGLKDQLEAADKKQVKYTLIMGQKEIADGTILIRDMESGVQEIVDYKKVKAEVRKRLDRNIAKNLKLKK